MKKIIPTILLLLTLAITACGQEAKSTPVVPEAPVVEAPAPEPAPEPVVQAEPEHEPEPEPEPEVTVIDIKDFIDILPSGFGGNLEEELSKAVFDDVLVEPSEYGFETNIGNGEINIWESANGDGYGIVMFEPLESFSMYGLQTGMPSDDAASLMSGYEYIDSFGYAVDEDSRVYISFTEEDGIVTRVSCTRNLFTVEERNAAFDAMSAQ